jgi:ribosome-associated protein
MRTAHKEENHRTPRQEVALEPSQLAHRIVDIISDKLASDIVLLDIRGLTTFADYFVICSAGSDRQSGAITDALLETLDKEGVSALHSEGIGQSGWVLVDYGDVIVHVFTPAERAYYTLEKLWGAAPAVLRMQ